MAVNNQNTNQNNNSNNGSKALGIIVFIVFFVIGLAMCSACDSGPSEFSQLSPQEQDRARWAYEVQQAQRDYERGR